jgi:hypothetical protein
MSPRGLGPTGLASRRLLRCGSEDTSKPDMTGCQMQPSSTSFQQKMVGLAPEREGVCSHTEPLRTAVLQ